MTNSKNNKTILFIKAMNIDEAKLDSSIENNMVKMEAKKNKKGKKKKGKKNKTPKRQYRISILATCNITY